MTANMDLCKLQDPNEVLHESSDGEQSESSRHTGTDTLVFDGASLILGSGSRNVNLSSLHPPPVQIFRLWQTFLDNVNPLTKLIHAPTVQQTVLEASGNLDTVPKSLEAFMFSMYCCAVCSMNDMECEKMLGEPKSIMLARYNSATQRALVNAGLLKTLDIITLQAFVLYIVRLNAAFDRTPF